MVTTSSISGLVVTRNRRIADKRGFLGELLPGGTEHPNVVTGIRNIYLSVASGAEPRAGHYHHQQVENFFPISGSVLWVFKDFRKDSETFNAVAGVAVFSGEQVSVNNFDERVELCLSSTAMIGITVPNGVYHVYWPLFGETSQVVCVASTPYDPADYVNIPPTELADVVALARPFIATT